MQNQFPMELNILFPKTAQEKTCNQSTRLSSKGYHPNTWKFVEKKDLLTCTR
jgi:hypothetical protein